MQRVLQLQAGHSDGMMPKAARVITLRRTHPNVSLWDVLIQFYFVNYF